MQRSKMNKKSAKESLVERMNAILGELSDMRNTEITDENYRKYYEEAANELNHEESEDGENDIYEFTYELCDEYAGLRNQLIEVLKAEGMDLEARREFYKTKLVG